jgi:hypothetical protein
MKDVNLSNSGNWPCPPGCVFPDPTLLHVSSKSYTARHKNKCILSSTSTIKQ